MLFFPSLPVNLIQSIDKQFPFQPSPVKLKELFYHLLNFMISADQGQNKDQLPPLCKVDGRAIQVVPVLLGCWPCFPWQFEFSLK